MSGAATEIERKFLVARVPPLDALASETVRQGYLTGPEDSVEIRLRQIGARHLMTVKTGSGLARSEREIAVTEAQFTALWPATEGRRLEKTRHTGRLPGGETFELDVFAGTLAPLVLVEVEFPTLDAARAFTPPDWFGTDVTADRRYKNRQLAFGQP
jgi:CYTH domain-containing protein